MYQISPSPQLEYKSLMARLPHRCSIVTVTANMIEQVTHTAATGFILLITFIWRHFPDIFNVFVPDTAMRKPHSWVFEMVNFQLLCY